jgi:transposase
VSAATSPAAEPAPAAAAASPLGLLCLYQPRHTLLCRGEPLSRRCSRPPVRFRCPDRSIIDPDPRRLDELIEDDHFARYIWDVVCAMDLSALHTRYKAREGHAGRSAIDVRLLVALWLLATLDGVGSARKLAKLCRRHDAYKWLCGGVRVSYHTLSDFRVRHGDWLRQQVIDAAAALHLGGLIDLERIAQDGLKIRASAGAGSFRGESTLEEALGKAKDKWEQLQKEFSEEQEQRGRRKPTKKQAAQMRGARERYERLQKAKEALQEIKQQRQERNRKDDKKREARASTTDPEARKMKMPDGGTRPAYNAQLGSDLDGLVVTEVEVINVGNDFGQMAPMAQQHEKDYGSKPEEYYADGGFATKEDIEKLSQGGIDVYTPIKDEEKKKERGEDPYKPLPKDSQEVAAWRQKMGTEEAKEKYKDRSKCEWVNAVLRNHGVYQVTVRGRQKVKAVVLWHALALNLMRGRALRAKQQAEAERRAVLAVAAKAEEGRVSA